ncbi:hypothetical protein Tco_1569674 [Tanacetum coccineum]
MLLMLLMRKLEAWNAQYDRHNKVACRMLSSMSPELQRQFENYSPYDMLQELKSMFEKHAGVERFNLIQNFHACKQEEGQFVSSYVLKMKSYMEKLERLGYVLPQDINVGLILNGVANDIAEFVRNYNMHNMGKTISELHAQLIQYEKGLPKKAATPQVRTIQGGKIQKPNKKPLASMGKRKRQRQVTGEVIVAYLVELMKKKKLQFYDIYGRLELVCPKKSEYCIWRAIQRISLTGFPAQSIGSSNTDVLDSPCLLVLITRTSQSRQHVSTSSIHIESCKSPTKSLFDVGSSRISIFIVRLKYHSDVLARSQG